MKRRNCEESAEEYRTQVISLNGSVVTEGVGGEFFSCWVKVMLLSPPTFPAVAMESRGDKWAESLSSTGGEW